MMTDLSPDQQQYLCDWETLKSAGDRDDKNVYLVKKLDEIQEKAARRLQLSTYHTRLLQLYEQEWDHQEIVIRVLRQLANKRRHDWSKDYLYIFALAGKFEFKMPGEEFERDVQEEIQRHYRLEPHHPEYEKTSGDISVLDIQEMATDRLSRNVWKNKGEVSEEQMSRYLPEFYGRDPQRKLTRYKECVRALEVKVKEVYHEVVRQTDDMHTLQTMWDMNVKTTDDS